MRVLKIVLLALACVAIAYAQPAARFERVGQVAFSEAEGSIKATRLLDNQTRSQNRNQTSDQARDQARRQASNQTRRQASNQSRIVLVGKKAVRVVDVATANVVQFRTLEIPDQEEENPRVISPDGRRLLVFGNYHKKDKKNTVLRPAAIWDLETANKIHRSKDRQKRVRAGLYVVSYEERLVSFWRRIK